MRWLLLAALTACAEDVPSHERVRCEQQMWGETRVFWCDPECSAGPTLEPVTCTYTNEDGREVTQPMSFVTPDGVRGYCALVRATMGSFRPYEVGFYRCDQPR